MPRKARETATKRGETTSRLRFPALEVEQGTRKLYLLTAKASKLYEALSINRRVESKDEGYQRALSVSRVDAITRHIADKKKPIPGSIVVCFDKGTYHDGHISVPAGRDVGWVIDGQHRLAGAAMAARRGYDIDMPVVAFLGLTALEQVEQFITINREAKNVPTSLYLDLLGKLPNQKPADVARDRATDIATQLKRDEGSPFFERIVVTVSPRDGQLSLVNFVRKIAPLVQSDKGILGPYTEKEQSAVIANYYKGLREVFASEFAAKGSIFFKTVGFGGLVNVLPTFFSLALKHCKGFEVKDVVTLFKKIQNFDFSAWRDLGTGSSAELQAGEDIKTALLVALNDGGTTGSLRV